MNEGRRLVCIWVRYRCPVAEVQSPEQRPCGRSDTCVMGRVAGIERIVARSMEGEVRSVRESRQVMPSILEHFNYFTQSEMIVVARS